MRNTATAITVSENRDEVNLTPMLDVVFIMLIFFIVTASFMRETGLDVNRSGSIALPPEEKPNILVAITADSRIWIEGRQIDPRALRAHIERSHTEHPGATVVIQAHARSATKALVQAMDASRQAGIYDIALAAD